MKWALIALVVVILSGIYILKPEISPGSEVINKLVVTNKPPVINEPEKVPEISLSIVPEKIIQGEPVLVTVNGTSQIASLMFNNRSVSVFNYGGKLSALVGIDLRMKPGSYPLVLTLKDGTVIKRSLVVSERVIVKAPFGIPDKLGGNTPESEKNLINSLVAEANIMNSIPTGPEKLWDGEFGPPLGGDLVVTDVYGYSRLTGASTFAHKGTDFRADIGTEVYAMNAGTVRYVGYLRNYGHTVVIDHGLGLQTIYMHLSEVFVVNGDKVEKGELVGKSGDTGYVMGPHLHISIKIDRISIDPMKFMELIRTN